MAKCQIRGVCRIFLKLVVPFFLQPCMTQSTLIFTFHIIQCTVDFVWIYSIYNLIQIEPRRSKCCFPGVENFFETPTDALTDGVSGSYRTHPTSELEVMGTFILVDS